MIRFVRLLGAFLGIVLALELARIGGNESGFHEPTLSSGLLLIAWAGAWAVVGFLILPYLTIHPAAWLIRSVVDLSTGEFVTAIVGLMVGLLMGLLLGLPLANVPEPLGFLLPIGVSIVLGLGMMGLTVAKRHDLFDALRASGILPTRAGADDGAARGDPVIIADTSAIIDGRITDVVAAGFLFGTLVVPRFVIAELQHIADEGDRSRRARGRRGLEILSMLQKDPGIAVELTDEDVPGVKEVDAKLISLAKSRRAAIVTTDFNLNRVAHIEGIRVLNLNHLANALKPAFLPGEEMRVKVIQTGKEAGQGVAYLDDGTMIVVEGGSQYMDRELEVTVTRVLQTVAGRMVFAQPRHG
jgi:uncharacterized protein YacL